ncbi:helix-turn-helix transcriptional regulator [Pedobacter sp. L105]|uniref:helix-turn-helix transcriptional regulator n=1 Tax=Pedobacter sp. L105 TaxID=1641871 RepID=UPI00131C1D21|nr:AraC family transcriptional regulator [Pedobacter sp. L105]
MLIEFVTDVDLNFLHFFAGRLNVPVIDNRLEIPSSLGEGFVRWIDIDTDFRMLVHRYRLKEELVLRRIGTKEPTTFVSIIFYSNEEPFTLIADHQQKQVFTRYNDLAVQIFSNTLDSTITFPANSEIYFTVVAIRAANLGPLLRMSKPDPLIQTIINSKDSYLFYESMSPEAQITLKEISEPKEESGLTNFFYRVKVESLLLYVFSQLHNRQSLRHNPINKADVEKLFIIRTEILNDLSVQPSLPQLAKTAGFSETKMKDLFRQVFGNSIYSYYQNARMEEAAFLLKSKGYSVSETGYALGFTNLSHFTRLFERHHLQKPKKYSAGA